MFGHIGSDIIIFLKRERDVQACLITNLFLGPRDSNVKHIYMVRISAFWIFPLDPVSWSLFQARALNSGSY